MSVCEGRRVAREGVTTEGFSEGVMKQRGIESGSRGVCGRHSHTLAPQLSPLYTF